MKSENVKTVLGILVGLIALGTLVLGVDKYFAKASAVDTIAERMDIGVSDDQIFQQEQRVREWVTKTEYEKREAPLTEIEQEIIKQERKVLEKLEQQRTEKIERYKSAK